MHAPDPNTPVQINNKNAKRPGKKKPHNLADKLQKHTVAMHRPLWSVRTALAEATQHQNARAVLRLSVGSGGGY